MDIGDVTNWGQVPLCSPQISRGLPWDRRRLLTLSATDYRYTKSACDKQVVESLMETGEVQKGTEQKEKDLYEKSNMEDNRILFVAQQ